MRIISSILAKAQGIYPKIGKVGKENRDPTESTTVDQNPVTAKNDWGGT